MRKKSKKINVTDDYQKFLESKIVKQQASGFEIEESKLNKHLFDWQRKIVAWALRLGRAALWESCGLGKSVQQLSWASEVYKHTGKPVLILTPLAVASQTAREAAKFGIDGVRVARDQSEVSPITITNYQKLDHFDPSAFVGVVLDESSILKSFMGTTKQQLVNSFANTPYRLACTATPAPNDHMELGNHAEFLGIMPSNEMLSRWFINDPANVGKYRLKGHATDDFWKWICSWACCIDSPADLGYDSTGFDLPPLNFIENCVHVDITSDSGSSLFRGEILNATTLHQEMKRTSADRAEAVAALIDRSPKDPGSPWLIWCNTDYEADDLKANIPNAVEVRGSHKDSYKEKVFEQFANNEIEILITKPSIAGFGLNWQNCHRMAFVGLSYSFEALYQALRRSWRFGQTKPVEAHVFFASTEGEILTTIKRKQADHIAMQSNMAKAMKEHFEMGEQRRTLAMEVNNRKTSSKTWEMIHGDCVEETRKLPDNHLHFSIYSPPFCNLYIYSDSLRDMGNATDDEEFFKHYDYLLPELLRATMPGRLTAVHCKDLPLYRGRDGSAGLKDFPGEIVRRHEKAGWTFHSRVTIWKCPVTERERTNNNGLLHKTVLRDSSQIRQGMADYLLVFRKPTEEDNLSSEPITRPCGFDQYIGDPDLNPLESDYHPSPYARTGTANQWHETPTSEQIAIKQSINIWRRYAEPVWWDINQKDVLNVKIARDDRDEKHICLARDSMVLTKERGYVPIQSIEIGDNVLTHLGRWRPVIAKEMTSPKAKVISLKAQGVYNLTVTPTHKLWARKVDGKQSRKAKARKAFAQWIEAKDMNDCYVNLKLPPVEYSDTSSDLWWIVGRWIADGHSSKRGTAYISVGKGKMEEFNRKVGDRSGFKAEGTATQVLVKDPDHDLRDILERCGKGAANKKLPPEAFTLEQEKAKSLLDGYLSGDGHYDPKRNRWTISTVSKELAIGLQLLILRAYGSVATIQQGRGERKDVICGRTVNAKLEWVVTFNVSGWTYGFTDDEGSWKPVNEISDAGEAETWNIRVEEDESYTAEGCVVKNCPLQLGLVKRAVYLWSNPGDLVYSPFAGIGSEGVASLQINRRFLGVELKESYYQIAIANLKKCERDSQEESRSLFDEIEETCESIS